MNRLNNSMILKNANQDYSDFLPRPGKMDQQWYYSEWQKSIICKKIFF